MKLDQLFKFVSVVRNESINKAALELFISQSSLSRSIKLLEEEMGSSLLKRTSRGITLTPFGAEVYDKAAMICANFELLENLQFPQNTRTSYRMRISSHALTFVEYAFVEIYKRYEKDNPMFSLVQSTTSDSAYDVKSGLSDVGISMITSASTEMTRRLMASSNLEYFPICHLPMEALLSGRHPLVMQRRKSVSFKELSSYAFCSGEGAFESNDLMALMHNHFPARNPVYTQDKAALLPLICSTEAYTLIPSANSCRIPFERFNSQNVVALPLSDVNCFFEIGWFKRKDQILPSYCEEFIKILCDMFL